jgi:hypothetical protein
MRNEKTKEPIVQQSQSFVGAGKHLRLKRAVSHSPIPKSEWKGLEHVEDQLALNEKFKRQIETSEREMNQGKRPRIRQP